MHRGAPVGAPFFYGCFFLLFGVGLADLPEAAPLLPDAEAFLAALAALPLATDLVDADALSLTGAFVRAGRYSTTA